MFSQAARAMARGADELARVGNARQHNQYNQNMSKSLKRKLMRDVV
jgi:hypothetical protein